MMSLYETLRRAIAMVLAVSMMLAVLPAVAAEEAVVQPLELEGEPVVLPLDPEGEPVVLPMDSEGEPVVLPLDPDDDAVILPEGPDDDTDLPTEGGTLVITWPDPDDTDEPASDDPANIPVTLPLFPDEELDGAAAEGVCKDLITEIEETGTEVIRWPEPEKGVTLEDDSEVDLENECGHNSWETIYTVERTCENDGYDYCKCTYKKWPWSSACSGRKRMNVQKARGHDMDDGTPTLSFPCLDDRIIYKCKYDDCDHTETTVVNQATAEHTPGIWQDQDKPGCCEQEFTTNCTVCSTALTKKYPAIRGHKFSQVDSRWEGGIFDLEHVVDFVCDYCGETKSVTGTQDKTTVDLVELGAVSLSNEATEIIQRILNKTMTDINNAETREQAIEALEGLHGTLVEELKKAGKVTIGSYTIGINDSIAESLLESLGITAVLEQVTEGADESFLSKESLQASVSKVVETIVSEDGTAVTKECLHDVLFSELFGLIGRDDLAPKYDTATDKLILQLAQTAAADDANWDELTRSLIDDLLNEALKELRSDKTVDSVGSAVSDALKKALPETLGLLWFSDTMGGVASEVYKACLSYTEFDALFNEVGDIVRNQLVNDPAFMKEVRAIVEKAAEHAKEGVDMGWSEEKIYANLRSDLSGVSDLVSRQVASLGTDASDFAEDKILSTVQKYLPNNRLGQWLGNTLGSTAKDLVGDLIEKESGSIVDTINSYIRYFTCPAHDWQSVVVEEATCTKPERSSSYCTLCGWKKSDKTETSGALGHDVVTDAAVGPTQIASGRTAGSHCARCGEVFVNPQSIPMLDPDIYAESEYHRAITEADAAALGYASLAELNAALDEAVRAAGFDPANSIRFTAQVDSSIGILPNDRFPVDGTEVLLPTPADAKEYYAVQVFTADVQNTNFHPAGDFMSTRVKKYSNRIGLDLYTQAIVIVAWKAE